MLSRDSANLEKVPRPVSNFSTRSTAMLCDDCSCRRSWVSSLGLRSSLPVHSEFVRLVIFSEKFGLVKQSFLLREGQLYRASLDSFTHTSERLTTASHRRQRLSQPIARFVKRTNFESFHHQQLRISSRCGLPISVLRGDTIEVLGAHSSKGAVLAKLR